MSLSLASSSDDDTTSHPAEMGVHHFQRFKRLGQVDDINKAVEYMSIALASTPDDHPDLLPLLVNLGACYNERFQRLGELSDIQKAIEYKSRALSLTTDDHPNMPFLLVSLEISHGIRYQRLEQPEDLDKGTEYTSMAVTLTAEDDPNLPHRLTSLGVSHSERFKRLNELADLEKATECLSRAVALTPNGRPQLPHRLASLGVSYFDRFQRLGELADLEKATESLTRAVVLTPHDHPDLPHRLTSLGVSHSERFKQMGELNDLEKAIEYLSRAIALTPNDHPQLPHRLASSGGIYGDRFKRLGELVDLEKAIECLSRAVTLTPNSHPHLPRRLTSLGVSHSDRFQQLGKLADLEKAIECKSHAVELTPNDHPDMPHQLSSLGLSYGDRFQRLGELSDLDKAIKSMSDPLSLTTDDHPDMPFRLRNLALAFSLRFRHSASLDDIQTATTYASCSVALTPDGHSDLPDRYHYLAKFQFIQSQATGDPLLMQDSLQSYRNASQGLIGSPRARFPAALEWATHASDFSSLNPIEAYQTAINLLPQFIWLGATTSQRYHDLDKAKNLAVRAASVAIQCSEHMLAIEWLEQARCVVWSQSLALRSPLEELQLSHPDLATRLSTVAHQLHRAGSESRGSREVSSDESSLEKAARKHRQLAQEYNDLLSEVRQLPGFEGFLKPTKANNLIRAARNGPIVVITCDTDRCDALLIQSGHDQVTHIPLPNFTLQNALHVRSELVAAVRGERARECERRPVMDQIRGDGFGSMLATLWHAIVKPVLGHLGYTNKVSNHDLPHVTWCPTGVMSFLPLHAAGDYDQPGSRVFDYVISSYTPTLTALLASTQSALSHGSRVLAIGQEATPGHTRLPGTTQELEYVQAHVVNEAQYTQLVNEQATTTAVLDAMEQHDWVHLACHAHQNVADATQSGFFLHDGTLDLAEINRRSFKNKGLAFLSACQTAMGDEKLPDEAVHLASGVLMAGYTSVIATMWSVHDEDAPVVADKVYAQLMKDGKLGNGEAGKALHNAVSELREQVGEKAFGRWVPYIHIGS